MKVYPSLEHYLDAAADYCGVSVKDMIGKGRARKVSRARWLYYIAARSTQRFSLPEIVKALSRDSHAVVHDAVKQAKRDCGDGLPVVMHRKNRQPWVLIVEVDRLRELCACVASIDGTPIYPGGKYPGERSG